MKVKLPQYNGKDNLVMVLILLPVCFFINSLYLSKLYYSSAGFFLLATLIAGAAFIINFTVCGFIAVYMKNRFPGEAQTFKRLIIMIFSFLLLNGLVLYALFSSYAAIPYFNVALNENNFAWSYIASGIITIFLTFIMEGIDRYNNWKENLKETEKLNAAYKQSQLNGLKSQVNPHFLFNSLNSLSSLIQEDDEKAEQFLDEMSKVYRYMLRNDEEQLVTLDTELKFLSSYMHLLKARYGDGLQLTIQINEEEKVKLLPPLTLQVMIENAFSKNVVSKSNPLLIQIYSGYNETLTVKNNIQPKAISDAVDFEVGLDNLVKKYELLGKPLTVTDKTNGHRIITVPLLTKKEEAVL
jgi:two-component system, LytTR family, sensor kinase